MCNQHAFDRWRHSEEQHYEKLCLGHDRRCSYLQQRADRLTDSEPDAAALIHRHDTQVFGRARGKTPKALLMYEAYRDFYTYEIAARGLVLGLSSVHDHALGQPSPRATA